MVVKTDILKICEMVDSWCEQNEMVLALDKSWFLPLGGQKEIPKVLLDLPVKTVTSARLLGVIMDQRLNFCLHISEVQKFWNFRLRILRVLVGLKMKFKKLLSICYSFRGKLTFGLFWWLRISDSNSERLCRFWRVAIRTIAGIEPSSPIDDFLTAMSIPALDQFIVFLLAKRQFDGKILIEKDIQAARQTIYNLRPRPPKEPEVHSLLRQSSDLVSWLRDEVKKKPKASPVGLLRRRMFGNKPHPDTDISELVKSANLKNSYFLSTQNHND